MNKQLKACKLCGLHMIRVEDDTCEWCGTRDRWVQSPAFYVVPAAAVTVIILALLFLPW